VAFGGNKTTPDSSGRRGIDYSRAFNQLCHVLSLSQTGKPRAALDSMVVTACALTGERVPGLPGVGEALDAFFGLAVEGRELRLSVDRLLADGRLVRSSDRQALDVPLAVRAEVERRADQGRKLEEAVRAEWLGSLGELPATVTAEDLWQCLCDYMARVFRQHGALSVELLSPTPIEGYTEALSLDAALDAATTESVCADRVFLRAAIQSFFGTPTASRAQYIAQLLDGTFTFFAVSIHHVASQYLAAALPPLTLFLDTNFVFGLLGLNDDPHGEAAGELLSFIAQNDFPFKLYIHQTTLDEIERTVSGIGHRLLERRWPSELSRAAISSKRVLGALTGLEYKYHELNAVQPIEPKNFLSKYRHVEELLADYAVKVFREPFNTLFAQDEDRGQLIAEYGEFVKERRPNEPKPYEALDHDITVWLAVRARRTPGQRTPIAGGVLFVTLDRIFKAFDRKFLRHYTGGIASVALPSQLLQVLRPYAKPTDDFDARFVELFGVSEFRTAHTGYEEVVPRVMSLLATFRDVSEKTATRILADELLLQDLSRVNDDHEFRDALDNALTADNARLLEEHEAERRERAATLLAHAQELAARDARIAELEATLDAPVPLPAPAEEAVSSVPAVAEVQPEVEDPRIAVAETRARVAFALLLAVVCGVCIGVVPWASHWQWLEAHPARLGLYLGAIAAAVALCWGSLVGKWKVALGAVGAVALCLLQIVSS
jgi:hypothetical protein